jgi:hypothetical protein
VLRAHPWNAALARTALAKVSPAPAWGWTNAFQLPADPYCLRVVTLTPGEAPFTIVGRWLMSDADSVRIVFIRRITDPTLYDSLLHDSLLLDSIATRLAGDLAESLMGGRAGGAPTGRRHRSL